MVERLVANEKVEGSSPFARSKLGKWMTDLADKKCVPCEGGIPAFDVTEIHKYIKDAVQSNSANNLSPKILYGGSVTDKNAESFFREKFVDGALIGGASLDGTTFAKIVNIFNTIKKL